MRLRLGRRGRPSAAVAYPGDVVIDGRVQARLLGVHLLVLDAHVVVGSATPRRPRPGVVSADATTERLPRPGSQERGRPPELSRSASTDGRDTLPLARAQRLLAEGSTVLAAARRMR